MVSASLAYLPAAGDLAAGFVLGDRLLLRRPQPFGIRQKKRQQDYSATEE